MRRLVTTLILSLFLLSGTGVAFADRHHDKDRDRKEYKSDKKRPGYGQGNRPNNNNNRPGHGQGYRPGHNDRPGHGDGYRPGHNNRPDHGYRPDSRPRPGYGQHHGGRPPRPHYSAPVPPPPPRFDYGYQPWVSYPYFNVLDDMVQYATRGCRDVGVWQIDDDTFIVKYRRGSRYYTQYLYPRYGRYGKRNNISIDWSPSSPWFPIPNIHLNIGF